MTRRRLARAAGAAALALALLGGGRAWARQGPRSPLLPDHVKAQLAGAVGLVSVGTGYALAGRSVELDAYFGWVPEAVAGVDLIALTGKLTWLPWTVHLGGPWRLRPFTAGLAVTYWPGDRFFVRNPDRYPAGYYPLPTALRGSVQLGGTLGRSVRGLSEVALYWELVAVDLPLIYWIQNRRSVDARDVVTLALGLRVAF